MRKVDTKQADRHPHRHREGLSLPPVITITDPHQKLSPKPRMKSKSITRHLKHFGMHWISEFESESIFRRTLEKKGFHVIETRMVGRDITGWCIYIRNLPKQLQELAKKLKSIQRTGDTINFITA